MTNPLEFKWEPPLIEVIADLELLAVRLESAKEPLTQSVEEVLAPSIRTNFEVGGRPAWAALADTTIYNRGGSDTPLIYTGALEERVSAPEAWTVTRDTASFNSMPDDVWYGVIHQEGTSDDRETIPARPFLMFQPEDEDRVEGIFGKWLDKLIVEANFTMGAL